MLISGKSFDSSNDRQHGVYVIRVCVCVCVSAATGGSYGAIN